MTNAPDPDDIVNAVTARSLLLLAIRSIPALLIVGFVLGACDVGCRVGEKILWGPQRVQVVPRNPYAP